MAPQKYVLTNTLRRSKVLVRTPPLLILLHGEGENEKELFELFNDADDRFVVVSLRAPFVQLENKYLWYSTSKYKDDYLANPAQLEYSRQHIIGDIKQLISAYHCDPEQVYIFGFSQGGVMAITILLTLPEMIAGIAVLNSYFLPELRAMTPDVDILSEKYILLCHGIYNQIIPIVLGRKLKYQLSLLPLNIDYQEYEIGHYYSKECVTYTKNWFSGCLDKAKIQETTLLPDYSTELTSYRINVINIDRSIDFYVRFLGMRLVERTGKAFAFLSNKNVHHVIELQLTDAPPGSQVENILGYHSVQYEVADKVSFAKAYWNLTEAGIDVSATDRIICWQMRFSDPDGNIIQIFWDTRHLPDRSDVWHGRELPLAKEKILEILINY